MSKLWIFRGVYVAALAVANLTLAGQLFGSATLYVNAFLLIGLDITLRDYIHELDGKNAVLHTYIMLLAAGATSYLTNPATGIIAVASVIAFWAAGAIDTLLYSLFKRRTLRVLGSNAGAAIVDSVTFPTIAFGGFDPLTSMTLAAVKFLGGACWFFLAQAVGVLREDKNRAMTEVLDRN